MSESSVCYKATLANGRARFGVYAVRGYEAGRTYRLSSEEVPVVAKRGFHFCRRALDVLEFYDDPTDLLWEVEPRGEIREAGKALACQEIRFLRCLSPEERRRLLSGTQTDEHGVSHFADGRLLATQWLHRDGSHCRRDSYDRRGTFSSSIDCSRRKGGCD